MDERLILVTNDDGYASKGESARPSPSRAALRPGGGRGARDGAERHV